MATPAQEIQDRADVWLSESVALLLATDLYGEIDAYEVLMPLIRGQLDLVTPYKRGQDSLEREQYRFWNAVHRLAVADYERRIGRR